ncbi:MAG: radical SAM protein [Spirochaetales bacterium]|nr:radical SAM protein [Spirochaetales bacterium]
MNRYLDLDRLEFIITDKCTSRCRHCSNDTVMEGVIDINDARTAIDLATERFAIKSLMTFGGEPLLYPDTVFAIHGYAREKGIPVRQIITNCFWTKDKNRIDAISAGLKEAGLNNVLVSIDCFHQEFLDFSTVQYGIRRLIRQRFDKIALHPCWYESAEGDNPYDAETRRLIDLVSGFGIPVSKGNVMLPEGRALHHFHERFKKIKTFAGMDCTDLPYCDRPDVVRSLCMNANGKINICDLGDMDVEDFFSHYNPFDDRFMKVFLNQKYAGLVEFAGLAGIEPEKDGYYSLCEACRDIRNKLNTGEIK